MHGRINWSFNCDIKVQIHLSLSYRKRSIQYAVFVVRSLTETLIAFTHLLLVVDRRNWGIQFPWFIHVPPVPFTNKEIKRKYSILICLNSIPSTGKSVYKFRFDVPSPSAVFSSDTQHENGLKCLCMAGYGTLRLRVRYSPWWTAPEILPDDRAYLTAYGKKVLRTIFSW